MHFAGLNSPSVRKDGETVSLGEVRLTARLTPGHTRHHDLDDYRRRRRLLWNGVRAFFKGSKLQMKAAQVGLQPARDVCEGSSCKRWRVENHLLAADVQRLRLDRERTHEFFTSIDRYASNEHQVHV